VALGVGRKQAHGCRPRSVKAAAGSNEVDCLRVVGLGLIEADFAQWKPRQPLLRKRRARVVSEQTLERSALMGPHHQAKFDTPFPDTELARLGHGAETDGRTAFPVKNSSLWSGYHATASAPW